MGKRQTTLPEVARIRGLSAYVTQVINEGQKAGEDCGKCYLCQRPPYVGSAVWHELTGLRQLVCDACVRERRIDPKLTLAEGRTFSKSGGHWVLLRSSGNGSWVCREERSGITCEFFGSQILGWMTAEAALGAAR